MRTIFYFLYSTRQGYNAHNILFFCTVQDKVTCVQYFIFCTVQDMVICIQYFIFCTIQDKVICLQYFIFCTIQDKILYILLNVLMFKGTFFLFSYNTTKRSDV